MLIKDSIPPDLVNRLPASIFYVRSKDTLIKNDKLHYAVSTLYCTTKMRCYPYYKPAFI